MSRWEPIVAVFVVVALLWGLGASLLVDNSGWSPLVATASTVLVIGGFAWMRRGRDILEVVAPAFAVAYAAYAGLAIVRASHSDLFATYWKIVPVRSHVPEIVLGGVVFALIATVFVAIPVSMIPLGERSDPHEHDRFWSFVQEKNALQEHVRPPERRS